MSETLAIPFRIGPQGHAQTLTVNSDGDVDLLIAAALLTFHDERALHPGYGCSDPRFASVSKSELQAQVTFHGPVVKIGTVTSEPAPSRPGVTDVVVEWERT